MPKSMQRAWNWQLLRSTNPNVERLLIFCSRTKEILPEEKTISIFRQQSFLPNEDVCATGTSRERTALWHASFFGLQISADHIKKCSRASDNCWFLWNFGHTRPACRRLASVILKLETNYCLKFATSSLLATCWTRTSGWTSDQWRRTLCWYSLQMLVTVPSMPLMFRHCFTEQTSSLVSMSPATLYISFNNVTWWDVQTCLASVPRAPNISCISARYISVACATATWTSSRAACSCSWPPLSKRACWKFKACLPCSCNETCCSAKNSCRCERSLPLYSYVYFSKERKMESANPRWSSLQSNFLHNSKCTRWKYPEALSRQYEQDDVCLP